MIHHATLPNPNHRQRGFNLMEVMLAMGIFVIGFVGVMSIFPAAALQQQRTTEDLLGQQAARNAEAIVKGARIDHTWLENAYANSSIPDDDNNTRCWRVSAETWSASYDLDAKWTVRDRIYPLSATEPAGVHQYWEVFVRRGSPAVGGTPQTPESDWWFYVFIVDNQLKENDLSNLAGNLPSMIAAADVDVDSSDSAVLRFTSLDNDPENDGILNEIRPGDTILDNNGQVYNVVDASSNSCTVAGFVIPNPETGYPTRIWYGKPNSPSDVSPVRGVYQFSLEDINQ